MLQNYVPAVVYTLYDGYYIYSKYNNQLDILQDQLYYENPDWQALHPNELNEVEYRDDTDLYGLKPYVYYSCRYKEDNQFDVVITYSLDTFITIQGTVRQTDGSMKSVNVSGYLLTDVNAAGTAYRGIHIDSEMVQSQYVYAPGKPVQPGEKEITVTRADGTELPTGAVNLYRCRKINGVRYYYDNSFTGDTNNFYIEGGEVKYANNITNNAFTNNTSAQDFYIHAAQFKDKFINTNGELHTLFTNLTFNDAVYEPEDPDPANAPFAGNGTRLFEELGGGTVRSIEDEKSNFNDHKKTIIRHTIETNLNAAIANYSAAGDIETTSELKFQMPKLSEEEWDNITKGIYTIAFLQGLNIGGKIYNGYAIVGNDINEDFVSEDSIYIMDGGRYYKITDNNLNLNSSSRSSGNIKC